MTLFTFNPNDTLLLIVDMQERIFANVERGNEILNIQRKVIETFKILTLPILITEQYPKGLGPTIRPIQSLLGEAYQPLSKTTFSCLDDPSFFNYIQQFPHKQFVVVGIEAHICILQTVKSLLKIGKEVAVLNDAISSRSIFDFSTSIAEMRDMGARISCAETVIFEMLKDSNHPQFKSISDLLKNCCCC